MSNELSFVTLDVDDPAAIVELLSTSEEDGYSSLGISSSSPEIELSLSLSVIEALSVRIGCVISRIDQGVGFTHSVISSLPFLDCLVQ